MLEPIGREESGSQHDRLEGILFVVSDRLSFSALALFSFYVLVVAVAIDSIASRGFGERVNHVVAISSGHGVAMADVESFIQIIDDAINP